MKIALAIAAVILAVVVLILAAAMTKPDRITVSRTIFIKAPAPVIFALINDFRKWPLWAPQDKEDASLVRTYGEKAEGVGATSEWKGQGASGSGSMTIIRSLPDDEVEVDVNFRQPFVAHNVNTFKLVPAGAGTQVTWTMQGTNVFMMKVMSVFVSSDHIVGPHFESGLQNLSVAAEGSSKVER